MKIIIYFFLGGGGGGEGRVGDQGGCDRRSEVFVKIQNFFFFFFFFFWGEGRAGGFRSGVGEGMGVARFGVGG